MAEAANDNEGVYPYSLDPEIEKFECEGLDESLDEPIILDDYRVDKTKRDITYFPPDRNVPPPTRRSVEKGLEMLSKTYCDDDPSNEWLYEDPKGPFITLTTKREWGAKPVAKVRQPLKPPVTHVRFSYTDTGTADYPLCFGILQSLQKQHMERDGLSDISYNFLVGKDGMLYEGRGWHVEADLPPEHAHLKGKCLDMAYIGDFKGKDPSWVMLKAGLEMIRYGLETKVIDPAFKLIPYKTIS